MDMPVNPKGLKRDCSQCGRKTYSKYGVCSKCQGTVSGGGARDVDKVAVNEAKVYQPKVRTPAEQHDLDYNGPAFYD